MTEWELYMRLQPTETETEDDTGNMRIVDEGETLAVYVSPALFGTLMNFPVRPDRMTEREMIEECPVCGQPDNCGDCDHTPLSEEESESLKR